MNLLSFHGVILVFISIALQKPFVVCDGELLDPNLIDNRGKRCRTTRQASLLAAICHEADVEDVPQYLKSGIQILDLSVNRLSDIRNNSFSRYTSLQFLDLGDNFLQTIEEGAFEPLQQLVALDLTKTRSVTLPKSLFTLPNLERLFLENNKLTDSVFKTKVTAPLKLLKAPKNLLTKIPQFGPFPTLAYLNLSENSISKISVDDFAPYCNLLTLDLSKNPITFDSSNCECQTFKFWTKEHNMTVRPTFKCEDNPYVNCFPVKISNRTMTLFKDCEEMIRIRIEIEKARSTWILVVSCVSGALVCISLILYCFHRRNKRRNRKLKKEQQLAASNANTELLNGNLKEEA